MVLLSYDPHTFSQKMKTRRILHDLLTNCSTFDRRVTRAPACSPLSSLTHEHRWIGPRNVTRPMVEIDVSRCTLWRLSVLILPVPTVDGHFRSSCSIAQLQANIACQLSLWLSSLSFSSWWSWLSPNSCSNPLGTVTRAVVKAPATSNCRVYPTSII